MNELEKFKAAIEPYRDGWKSIDIRVVCCLAYKKWVSLGTRIILSEEPPNYAINKSMLPEFPGFSACHETQDIMQLDSLLDQLGRGILSIAGREVHFGTIENNDIKANPSFCIFQDWTSRYPVNHNIDYPHKALWQWTESFHNLLNNHPDAIGQETLDLKLRTLNVPYEGLDDLLVSFLGLPRQSRGEPPISPFIAAIAPVKLRLGKNCKMSNGKLDIYLEAMGYKELNEVSLGLIEFSGNIPLRRNSINIDRTDWKNAASLSIAHKEISVQEKVSSVMIILRFRGSALQMLKINDPSALLENPKISAYSHFDKDLTALKKYLGGSGKGADLAGDFEIGVGLLLHFCGFNTALYGRVKAISEEIDVISFVPSSDSVIAAECTTKDLDVNDKLSKFSRRVKELRGRLFESTIIPLIFTALERSKISEADIEKAHNEGIGVVSAEEINILLEMAATRQPDEILIYLQSLLPEDKQKSIFDRLFVNK